MTFRSSTSLVKIAFFISVFAFVITAVGVFTPNWMVISKIDYRMGLVYVCTSTGCSSGGSGSTSAIPDWYMAMLVMELFGILFAAASLIFITLYIFCAATSGKKWTRMVTLCLTYGAAFLLLIGVIICAAKKNEVAIPLFPHPDLGWSFALTVVAGLLYLGIGVMLLMDVFL
ncbi:hypothetical protein C0Q70_13921 [Pomacea canaliculata]|uniref:MARVEL domain-containing protein n=1 Tax=Pomacea canaliculata TaxID=400727 RepID=A0A2T7NYM1_POMCA|nr:uncharacterized protein LOC112571015 [Pomacea canaliculata]PVD26251.1 hypothetical protein C0Q70_13921 [Pomacea canaliculata]